MKDIIYKLMADIDLSPVKPSFENISATGATITIAQIICYGAAVIILMILGVKFMTATPEGKAQIKEKSVPAVIGAVHLFAVGSIIRIVADFGVANISG